MVINQVMVIYFGNTKGYTCVCALLCPTLFNPIDCSLPGSSDHGISQASTLEWVAVSSSSVIFLTQGSNPCLLHLLHWQVDPSLLRHLGSHTKS